MKKIRKIVFISLIICLIFSINISAQSRTSEDTKYINVLKDSYFPNIQHKALTIGQVLKGLEVSINKNKNIGGTYSFNVTEAPNIGKGQGKYIQMILKVNNTAISIHFWVDKQRGYTEYLGGEMDDNGNQITDYNQILKFINMAYNTALETY